MSGRKPKIDSQAPALDAFAITPDDDTDLGIMPRALYIGVGGDVEAITSRGTTVVFKNLQSGEILPVICSRVKAGSTTATNILGLV